MEHYPIEQARHGAQDDQRDRHGRGVGVGLVEELVDGALGAQSNGLDHFCSASIRRILPIGIGDKGGRGDCVRVQGDMGTPVPHAKQ